ncbi:MAG: histidine phosphatase family protein [Pseudomonadota bacterium]
MQTLYIVRHGNTFDTGDTVLRVGGRTDLPLSTSGEMQATALGIHFAVQEVRPVRILVGPLKRTRQTAEAIIASIGGPEPEIDNRLREIDYGPDEGKPEDEVVARIGKDALAAWEREARVPDGWKVKPAALETAWKDIIADMAAHDGDVMAVTSNGIARFALSAIGAPSPESLKLSTGAYGVITVRGFDLELVAWNVRPQDHAY